VRVLIFGDSITQGFDDPDGGWVEHLKRDYLQQKTNGIDALEIFNLGISGDTSADVLRRIENEISVRRWPNDPVMTILAIGVNDSADKRGQRLGPLDEYEVNIKKLLNVMTKMSDQQLIVGLTPCVDSLLDPAAWSENDFRASNQRVRDYEQALLAIVNEHNLQFVPIWEKFMNEPSWEGMLPDGLHPNTAGHNLIYKEVKKVLDSMSG
jgi:lysophospholipase L1-like esterase